MNGRYVRELDLDDLTARLEAMTGRSGLRDAVAISQEKMSTLDEFWPMSGFFFDGPVDDPKAREKFLGDPRPARASRWRPSAWRPCRRRGTPRASRRRCGASSRRAA